jgi:hypothetical protein
MTAMSKAAFKNNFKRKKNRKKNKKIISPKFGLNVQERN